MHFVLIDDAVCIATNFEYDIDKDITTLGSSTSLQTGAAATDVSIDGKMLLFRRDTLPSFMDEYGIPKRMSMSATINDCLISVSKMMITSMKELCGYDTCDAIYVEWVADKIQITKTKDINRRISI